MKGVGRKEEEREWKERESRKKRERGRETKREREQRKRKERERRKREKRKEAIYKSEKRRKKNIPGIFCKAACILICWSS